MEKRNLIYKYLDIENKKFTAIEWLEIEIKLMWGLKIDNSTITKELIEQAKRMEKDQIMDVCYQCGSKGNELKQINQDNPMTRGSTALVKVTSSQTEISDDDIEKAAENYAWTIKTNTFSNPVKANELAESSIQDFKAAIKWYREQLKNK